MTTGLPRKPGSGDYNAMQWNPAAVTARVRKKRRSVQGRRVMAVQMAQRREATTGSAPQRQEGTTGSAVQRKEVTAGDMKQNYRTGRCPDSPGQFCGILGLNGPW